MRTLMTFSGLVLILGTMTQANAGTLGLDFTGSGAGAPGVPVNAGWTFTVNAPITIVSLGIWDDDSDGLEGPHDVGLWNSNGTSLLATTTVTNASTPVAGASSVGRWLFNSITPLLLNPATYVIAATYDQGDPDRFIYNGFLTPVTLLTPPEVTYVGGRLLAAEPLTFPRVVNSQTPSYFGPNFEIQSVPEPSSLLLLVTGGMGLCAYTRRRMKRREFNLHRES